MGWSRDDTEYAKWKKSLPIKKGFYLGSHRRKELDDDYEFYWNLVIDGLCFVSRLGESVLAKVGVVEKRLIW